MVPGRSEAFNIEITDSPKGAKIFKLSGPLTLSTLFDFQAISRKETTASIILDVTDVPYMDSAGLGSVISVYASCQRTKRGFAIIGISERIRTLFEVTHCDGLLPCYDDLEAADQAIASYL
jgi:anti-anti-sigma factor